MSDATAADAPGPAHDDLGRAAQRRRTVGWTVGLAAAVVVSTPVTVGIGPTGIGPGTVAAILVDHLPLVSGGAGRTWSDAEDNVVWQVRAPRVLLALAVGASLALCGVALQAIVRNVLAEPYLLGITSGASTGAAATILFGVGLFGGLAGTGTGEAGLTGSAFAGALVATAAVYVLGRRGGRVTSVRLLLAGVAVGYVLSAVTSFLVFASDAPEGARAILYWLLGSLGQAEWSTVRVAAVGAALALATTWWWSRSLDALAVGDATAHSLGSRPTAVRTRVVVVVAFATGSAVAVAGGIGFVGLVVPHVARVLVGGTHRALIPVAALLGALFLLWADVVARTAFEPRELPLGIVTAVVGAPFLFVLVRRTAEVES